MTRYKIADVVLEGEFLYDYTPAICKEYLYEGDEECLLSVKMTEEDIAKEMALAPEFSARYLESLAFFRKICEYILEKKDGIIFHSSAIAVDGEAYLFTAPSGTGKSTHARLWREMLGDKAVMINDDKPIIRYIDGKFYVYGTPWMGKHRLGSNTRAEIKAICRISQGKENVIEKASTGEMLMVILNQTLRPNDPRIMDKFLGLVEKMLKEVDLYRLSCNISKEAAELSYKTMSGDEL